MTHFNKSTARTGFAIAAFTALFATASLTPAASITALGDLPGSEFFSLGLGVSGDGTTVVGKSTTGDDEIGTFQRPFRWTAATGITGFGNTNTGQFGNDAAAASFNGQVVVGGDTFPEGPRAYRWTAATGEEPLGVVSGFETTSLANGVSGNGLVVVGISIGGSQRTAFRWTASTGPVGLGDLPGGTFRSEANGISRDGTTIVGSGQAADGVQAFRWTAAAGMVPIPRLSGVFSEAHAVSADGSVIVGESESPSGRQAFRWTAATGPVGLGDLPGGAFVSSALSCSDDGNVIVGTGAIAGGGSRATVWTPEVGLRRLDDVLLGLGVNVTASGWTALFQATGVSADGLTVSGWGTHNGRTEAFVATIPEPASMALFGAAAVLVRRRGRRNYSDCRRA